MSMTVALILIGAAFIAGAVTFRNNPIAGAKTLDELEAAYQTAKAKLKAKF